MCRLRVALLLLAGCDHRLPPAPAGGASSSPPPPAALPGSSGGAPDRPVPSKTELPPTLRHFFAGYTDRSDFEFMRADCRPIMDRFVTLQNVEVGVAIRDARSFFRDKHDLAYGPDLKRVRAEPHAGGTTVRLPVTMSWTYPIPKEWGPDWPAWGTESPAVARSVTVDVEIEVDADGRIARYVETHVESPWLRVTGSDECAADDSRPTPRMDLMSVTWARPSSSA